MTIYHQAPLLPSFIFIDPGINGAIAYGNTIEPMPTRTTITKPAVTIFARDSKNKKILIKSGPNKGNYKQIIKTPAKSSTTLDCITIKSILSKHSTLVIEKIGRTIGNSSASSTTVATNFGKIIGIAESLGLTIHTIAANKWKADLSLPSDKLPTIELAESITSRSFRTPRGRLLDGLADAYIIGYHYELKHKELT